MQHGSYAQCPVLGACIVRIIRCMQCTAWNACAVSGMGCMHMWHSVQHEVHAVSGMGSMHRVQHEVLAVFSKHCMRVEHSVLHKLSTAWDACTSSGMGCKHDVQLELHA